MKIAAKILSALFLIWSLLVFIAAMLLVLPFILIVSTFFNGNKSQEVIFFFLRVWGFIFCTLAGFPVKRVVNPGYRSGHSYIYVANHNSYLDAIAVVRAIPGSFRPLGKVEMVKIPIFGIIYRRVVVLIDRASKESRAQSVENLKEDIRRGQSILIFPEGTMNRSSMALAEFYDGAFKLAIETQTPIAPLVIQNARNLFPRDRPLDVRPGLITCFFDEPIAVNGLTAEDLPMLKERVFARMREMITEKETNISVSVQ